MIARRPKGSLIFRLVLVTVLELALLFAVLVGYQQSLTRRSRDEAYAYSRSLCTQTADLIENRLLGVRQATLAIAYFRNTEQYLNSSSVSYKLEIQTTIFNLAQYFIDSNADIVDIALVDMDRNLLSYNGLMDVGALNSLARVYPDMLSDTDMKPFFTPILSIRDDGGIYYAFIMPIFSTDTYERVGSCIALCNGRNLRSLLADAAPNENDYIISLRFEDNNREMTVVNSDKAPKSPVYFTNELMDLGMFMQSTLDITALPDTSATLQDTITLFGGLMVFLVALTMVILYFSFTKPLQKLLRHINRIGSGKYTRLESLRTAELNSIVSTINTMLEEIEANNAARLEGQTKLYAAELTIQQARFSALQSQINPHFLYNTLECMRSIGLVYNAREIVDMSVALSAIFRYSIKGSNIVRVREEMDIIAQYLRIISVRFGDRFTFHWEVPEGLQNLYILKMILQPLVENAVYHGLEPKEGPGTLVIRGALQGETLVFEVADDGVGMEPDELEGIHTMLLNADPAQLAGGRRSIGLENIHQRIRLTCGAAYGLKIESEKDRGTTVQVLLPVRRSEEL